MTRLESVGRFCLCAAGCFNLVLSATSPFGCASERYSRPPGPAPRYESAPLAPWANEATAEPGQAGEGALESEIERALSADAGQGLPQSEGKPTTQ
jgi:hypothetical protein